MFQYHIIMASSHTIIVSVIICLTFLNFMMWSKTNYGATPHIKEIYSNLINYTNTNTDVNQKLEEIRWKINQLLERKPNNSEDFEQLLDKMKKFSTGQVSSRKKTLAGITYEDQYYLLYGAMAPEVFCPEKVRVGTVGDGGKWVCNPWNVPRDTVLFSLGLNNYIGFEEDWQKMTRNGNILYGFDVDEQSESTKKSYSKLRGTTKKALISETTSRNEHKFTIEDLAKESNVTSIEILKIDIEGAELTCLIPFLEKYPVCQIYLEVHGGAPEHAKLLREIAHLGYRLFSYEVNGYAMSACEYSFINEKCVEKYGGMRIANYLDFM